MTFHLIDWIIVLIYAAVILFVGLVLVRKPKTSEGYFLANRRLKWPFIGASMLASNISAEHFVGLAGMGYAIGIAAGASYEWIAVFCILPLVLVFLPLYMKSRIYTVPEYLERRFSPGVRTMFSALMLVLSVLTKISISLWASALVFSTLFGWNHYAVIAIVGLVTAAYTMKGGLGAVIYTDAIQAVVLITAGAILLFLGLHSVGGWTELQARVPDGLFHAIKPMSDPDVPWTGVYIGILLAGSFTWSMDQVLVQRVFAAKNLNEGRKGAIFAASLKLLMPFVLVMPGIIARALYPNLESQDQAYPTLLKDLMPHGLLGLTVAGITAALMGHLSATYNSISTLFTRDFYVKWFPQATHERQIWVGRTVVLAVAVLGIFWAPIIGRFKSLWDYLQIVSVYLVMPFVGVFFLGALWRRITTAGVWASVLTGFVIGPALMIDRMASSHFLPSMDSAIMKPWLHGAILELIICVTALIGVSLVTRPVSAEQMGATVLTRETFRGEDEAAVSLLQDYRLWLAVVLVATFTLYFVWR